MNALAPVEKMNAFEKMTPFEKIQSMNISAIFPAAVSRRRIWLAVILWFLVCLASTAPAQLLVLLLKPLAPQLQLQDVDGNFWRGSASQAFWSQRDKVVALGKTDWQINPWSLLWLHPSAHVATHYGEQFIDTQVRVSPLGRIALRDTTAAVPAQFIGYWLPLPAQGLVALKLAAADISRQRLLAANGDIYWQQAQWQWGRHWLALGDYRCALRIETAGDLHCALQGQGALGGGGDISADFNKKIWAADLKLKVASSLPDEFRQMLTALLAAQPDAQGQMQIKKDGHW
jgi:hypothetical protein